MLRFNLSVANTMMDAFVERQAGSLEQACLHMLRAILRGGKVMACGNGGSASDASHFVAELVGRFMTERAALPAVSLVSDPATVTALSNDYGYERVFERQVQAIGRPGDVLLAISTSGQSPNVVAAAKAARGMGIKVVALVGQPACLLAAQADVVISAPGPHSSRIQEVHIFAIHNLCEMIEQSQLIRPSFLEL